MESQIFMFQMYEIIIFFETNRTIHFVTLMTRVMYFRTVFLLNKTRKFYNSFFHGVYEY